MGWSFTQIWYLLVNIDATFDPNSSAKSNDLEMCHTISGNRYQSFGLFSTTIDENFSPYQWARTTVQIGVFDVLERKASK